MIDPRIPSIVIHKILDPMQVLVAKEVPPGLSGAAVFRCKRTTGGDFALKRWPGETSQARVEEVHRVMVSSRTNGCRLVPKIIPLTDSKNENSRTLFMDVSGLWEAQQWVSGSIFELESDKRAGDREATMELIKNGARAIREFHCSVQNLGTTMQPPPAAEARLKRVAELSRRLPGIADRFSSASMLIHAPQNDKELTFALRDASRLIAWKWDVSASRIAHSMRAGLRENVETQYVLRDIHRDHVFYLDQKPVGLIDFDAVRVDTPLTDLARWVGSWMTDFDETGLIWKAASAGFFQNPPFLDVAKAEKKSGMLGVSENAESQIGFAKELCFATNWISLGNWMVWLLQEKRAFPAPPTAIATRIRQLIRSCSRGF